MAKKVSQLRRGVLELAILALLGHGEKYGGEVVDDLARRDGLEAGPGTVYPLLTRLGTAGYVDTFWEESPSGPPRKYYRLTRAGTAQLSDQRDTWRSLVSSMDELMEGTA
ncbi:PadR family transcriptional regulator [Flaviflexus huanghaiensis]|uniref:PadR family transcriptional regulator n=1 Tax=Flaviflexus huanghaiensis TaxID=1111473 RepID=UPI0015F88317|nr:PadR family transcriptional regulator [Flaviflexus huanghaiensis]